MLEASVAQQEEYFRKNLAELSDQHTIETKILTERYLESEHKFFEIQKQQADEMTELRKMNAELKSKTIGAGGKGNSTATGGKTNSMAASDQQFLTNVQNENNMLQTKVKELMAEKISLQERLKVFYYFVSARLN